VEKSRIRQQIINEKMLHIFYLNISTQEDAALHELAALPELLCMIFVLILPVGRKLISTTILNYTGLRKSATGAVHHDDLAPLCALCVN